MPGGIVAQAFHNFQRGESPSRSEDIWEVGATHGERPNGLVPSLRCQMGLCILRRTHVVGQRRSMDLAEMSCLCHRDRYERQVPATQDVIDGARFLAGHLDRAPRLLEV